MHDPRFERQVERLLQLGPRAIGELLAEIATETGESEFIAERVAEYAERLDPEIVRALRADEFPPVPLSAVV